MTNAEVREAVIRIASINRLIAEADRLRRKIEKEIKRRRKDKLNLGGPHGDDFVALRCEDGVERLTYKVNLDENNMYRGIKL
jgi:hypothetical protein